MADNYTQFSFEYPMADGYDIAELQEYLGAEADVYATCMQDDTGNGWEAYGLTVVFRPTGVAVYAEESGDIDAAIEVIHALHRKTGADKPFTFSYACTCSKPRVDEFSGATIAVHPDGHTATGAGEYDAWAELVAPRSALRESIRDLLDYAEQDIVSLRRLGDTDEIESLQARIDRARNLLEAQKLVV